METPYLTIDNSKINDKGLVVKGLRKENRNLHCIMVIILLRKVQSQSTKQSVTNL